MGFVWTLLHQPSPALEPRDHPKTARAACLAQRGTTRALRHVKYFSRDRLGKIRVVQLCSGCFIYSNHPSSNLPREVRIQLPFTELFHVPVTSNTAVRAHLIPQQPCCLCANTLPVSRVRERRVEMETGCLKQQCQEAEELQGPAQALGPGRHPLGCDSGRRCSGNPNTRRGL